MALQYISELLIHHDCVVVPGLGGFISNYAPARIHPVLHTFQPPSRNILFNPKLKTNDGLLAHHVSVKENISYDEAIKMLAEEVAAVNSRLSRREKQEVSMVGSLFAGPDGNILFEAATGKNYLLDAFGLEEFVSPAILRKQKTEEGARVIPLNADPRKSSKIRRIAAISIPAAAVLIWGFLSTGAIREAGTNYSDILSVFRSSPEINVPYTVKAEMPGRLTLHHNIFRPADKTVSISDAVNGLPTPVLVPVLPQHDEESYAENCNGKPVFYIIGACYKTRELAENYLEKLRSQGYGNAGMVGPSGKGFYKVYFSCHADEKAAREALKQIRSESKSSPWLLKG